MKWFLPAAAVIAPAAAVTEYLARFADSFVRHGVEIDYHYTQATLYKGFEKAYELTKNETLLEWYKGQVDGILNEDGTLRDWDLENYSLDDYRIGNNLLYWYKRTGDIKYRTAAGVIRQQLNRHPQTKSAGFVHRYPVYANQMWLDGIFMADTFYAAYTNALDSDNATAWNHIANQFDQIEAHCRDPSSALLFHGWDESRNAVWADPTTGAAPIVWDRAVGWYMMALVETIPLFPAHHPALPRLIGYFTSLADAVRRAQDPATGGWWLVMNSRYVAAAGNYIESSGSVQFTWAWLEGIRLGYLPATDFLPPARKAYRYITDTFLKENSDGTLNWEGTVSVGSLSGNGTYEYYIGVPLASNDYKGAGPFMYAAYEWETWAGL